MADQSISELISADQIRDTDLFLLEQGGDAKSLAGRVLLNWLTAAADGHGGIQSIAKLSSSGLTDTYRITLADTTTVDFTVTNGRAITGIKKTATSGLVDTYTVTYNDDTTSTFTVTNGAKGDKGDNAYTWIKYASQQPTAASHSMGDIPDTWMGIYTGTLAAAPTDWTLYKWYRVRGDQGETGAPATLTGRSVTYMASDSGTVVPSGSWSSDVPTVGQGRYLWTRVVLTFNTGSPVTYYSVSRMGLDGTGSVSSVNSQNPDSTGNVKLTAADIADSDGQSVEAALAGKQTKITSVGLLKGTGNGGVTDAVAGVDYQTPLTAGTDYQAPIIAGAGVRISGTKVSTAAAPRNLLDNSDFRNPVNQRGQTSYTSAHGGYAIDRWIANAAITLNVNAGSVTAISSGDTQNEFYQSIANPDRLLGKTVTFAMKTDIGTFVTNATIPSNFTDNWVVLGTALIPEFGQIRFQVSDNNTHAILAAVAVKSGGSVTIHWVALYEGAYTADTLPKYQPKEYGAELAECQRYFLKLGDASRYCSMGTGVARDTQFVSVSIPTPITMRTTPGLVSAPAGFHMRHGDSKQADGTEFTVDASSQNSIMLKVKSQVALTAGEAYEAFLEPNGSIMFSADL